MDVIIEENYIKALSNGDRKAFEVLFLAYYPKLIFFLNGFIKDNEQARDMAQDIFFSIWNQRDRLSGVKSFKAYVFKMAKNAVCNYYDHAIVNDKFIADQLTQSVGSESTEETVLANQLQNLIDIAVSQMPPQRKQIFIMSRVDGLSNDEIAEKLKINKRTVENHLTSALADIRKTINLCITLFI